jgi:phage tail tape-measure protein
MRRRAGVGPAGASLHKEGHRHMKAIFATALLVPALALTSIPADAKGCIKGAIVGGIAGHYANHHGLIGAATGCLVGRHLAKKHQQELREQQQHQQDQHDDQWQHDDGQNQVQSH